MNNNSAKRNSSYQNIFSPAESSQNDLKNDGVGADFGSAKSVTPSSRKIPVGPGGVFKKHVPPQEALNTRGPAFPSPLPLQHTPLSLSFGGGFPINSATSVANSMFSKTTPQAEFGFAGAEVAYASSVTANDAIIGAAQNHANLEVFFSFFHNSP